MIEVFWKLRTFIALFDGNQWIGQQRDMLVKSRYFGETAVARMI
jgi:hypothetical protein